jgi:hypothetical protein
MSKEQYLDHLSSIFVQCRKVSNKPSYTLGYRHPVPPYAFGEVPISKEIFTALESQTFAKKSGRLREKIAACIKHAKRHKPSEKPVIAPTKRATGKPQYQTVKYCLEFNMDAEHPDEYQWNLDLGGINDRWLMNKDECIGKLKIRRREQPELAWRMVRRCETKTVVHM